MEAERVSPTYSRLEMWPQTIVLDPAGWVEEAARIVLETHPDRLLACRFGVTSPIDLRNALVGRPAEELPRILPALSSVSAVAHHVASASALDRVFNVQPPPAGEALREALLEADTARAHLKRLAILLTAPSNPLLQETAPLTSWSAPKAALPPTIAPDLLRGAAQAQEIVQLIGGRVGMPVCAVPGGFAHELKEQDQPRFSILCDSLFALAQRLRLMLAESVFTPSAWFDFFSREPFCLALPFIGAGETGGEPSRAIRIVDVEGNETIRFSPDQAFEQLGQHTESEAFRPFVFLNSIPWPGLEEESSKAFFQTGPLARLNIGQHRQPEAIEERQRLAGQIGSALMTSLAASLWASLVELLEASARLVELSRSDVIGSQETRTLPVTGAGKGGKAGEGAAAIEGPAGLVVHAYRTDGHGLIQEAAVLDPSGINHAARNLASQKVARYIFRKGRPAQGDLRLVEYAAAAY